MFSSRSKSSALSCFSSTTSSRSESAGASGFSRSVRLVGQSRIALVHLQHRILVHFLFDAFLQRHDRQLQNLHRLDHPRSQFLDLDLSCFESE